MLKITIQILNDEKIDYSISVEIYQQMKSMMNKDWNHYENKFGQTFQNSIQEIKKFL